MSERFAKAVAYSFVSILMEQKVLPKLGLNFLNEPYTVASNNTAMLASVPRGFGLVIVVLSLTYLWLLVTGFATGKARSKYIKLAIKDGEKDVEERFAYPNLYAQGTSKHVRAFNCVQRSHQQVLESFTGYVLTTLFAAIMYPITAAVFASLWWYSRTIWVASYAASEGNPSQRYDRPFSSFFWDAMLTLFMTSSLVGIQLILNKDMLALVPDL